MEGSREATGTSTRHKIKKILNTNHSSTLVSIANLALTYKNQGWWRESEKLQVQVINTSKKTLGTEHPSMLTSIANLAYTYWSQERYSKAFNLMELAQELRVRTIGENHPDTIAAKETLEAWTRSQDNA